MAAAATALVPCRFALPPRVAGDCFLLFRPFPARNPSVRYSTLSSWPRRPTLVSCVLKEVGKEEAHNGGYASKEDAHGGEGEREASEERMARKQSERRTYLIAAVMSSFGITSMAVASVYYRFSWQMEGGEVPLTEMFGTFALSVGAAVGMEFWARWAHRALWHASLWHMHESHHRPRDGPFELNDVFAIINAVPAISLMAYGFLNRGLLPGLCFGAGLGITLFGMAYMFVHDGLVHRRFPVGPIANVPYFRRVAAAHQIHHMDKFDGVPYGLFLGPKELEEVGGLEELEKEISRRIKLYNNSNLSS
ncbi:beta-carotene 3-hydroxylase 2, chloroplastic-like [Musa acuminata AAA Group]|uniref:beta-carotene 3-hydroxylase 2, chloroplastic-like n=1 Tax=Musa acuminata AAA Group TaxID=214697 RepID=UPI0031DEE4B7